MIWIEILGPSGVGKSYWFEKFIQRYPEYDPKAKVLQRIYESEDLSKHSLKIRMMFWVLNLNLYRISNHFKHKLFFYFQKGFQRRSKTIFTQNDDILIGKYLKNIDSLNEPQIIVLKKIEYFHTKLIEFKFYEFYLNDNDVYLAEDGLMHLAPTFIEELKADKVLIFEKGYDKLIEQRIQRAKNNPTTFIEFLLNEENLISYIHNYYKLYTTKIQAVLNDLKPNQTKTINLDKEDVLKEMHSFINEQNK